MSDIANLLGTPDGFDPMSVEPQEDYVAVPPGKYPVEIQRAEMEQTKAGTGHYLELQCKILAAPKGAAGAVGRFVWDRLNLDNPSAVAVEIAMRSFAALGRSVGLARIPDSQLLVGKRCLACVKVKDGKNEIRTYEPLPTAAAPAAPVALVQPAAPVPGPAPVRTQVPGSGPVAPVEPVAPAAPVAAPVTPLPTMPGAALLPGGMAPAALAAPVAAPVAPAPVTAAPAATAPVAPVAPVQAAAVGPTLDAAGQALPRPWQT